MSFGNGKSQSNPADCQFAGVNNFCGGFAADAILSDIAPNTGNPMGTYQRIQAFQQEHILESDSSPYSRTFIFDKLTSGTAMSLPSAICHVLSNSGQSQIQPYGVFCTESFFKSGFFPVLKEEVVRIQTLLKGWVLPSETSCFTDINALFRSIETGLSDKISYLLVLVKSSHWVAVKGLNSKFVCYDPGKEANNVLSEEKNTILEALMAQGYTQGNIDGLAIVVTRPVPPPQPVSSI